MFKMPHSFLKLVMTKVRTHQKSKSIQVIHVLKQ